MAVKRRLSVPLPRKDGGRVFVKQPDPHEEALTILRGQMSPPVAAPGTQVRGWGWWGPGETEDKEGASGGASVYCGGPSLWGQVPREAVALVKPVTSTQRPSMGPAPGEGQEGGRGRRAGV